MSEVNPNDIEALIEVFNASDWDEMHLVMGDFEIFLSNDSKATLPGAAPAAALAPSGSQQQSQTAAPAAHGPAAQGPANQDPANQGPVVPDGSTLIRAPSLGTFYRAPKPGSPPYVEVGQRVEPDTELCLIEVMKLFTHLRSGMTGIVREICVPDATLVEFDQPLFVIEPVS